MFTREDNGTYDSTIKFITVDKKLGSPVNSKVETGLWFQLIDGEREYGMGKESIYLRVGLSGQQDPVVDVNLSELHLERLIHSQGYF